MHRFMIRLVQQVAGFRLRGARLGQGTVEFALVSLVMFPFVIGGIELGRAVWTYNQLSTLSREGARWLIVTTDSEIKKDWATAGNAPALVNTYTLDQFKCPAIDKANWHSGNCTAVGWMESMAVGLDKPAVAVIITRGAFPGEYTWGAPVTVELQYQFKPILATYLGLPVEIPLRASTTMRFQ